MRYPECIVGWALMLRGLACIATVSTLAAESAEPCIDTISPSEVEREVWVGDVKVLGCDGKQDEAKVAQWFRRAANQGLRDAEFSLGMLYIGGRGVRKSETEALRWFWKEAEQGDAEAAYNVATLLAKGSDETGRNVATPHYWYRLAEDGRYPKATGRRQSLERLMTPEQIKDAKKGFSTHRTEIVP